MTNSPTEEPTNFDAAEAAQRRLAYWNQPIVPAIVPAQHLPPRRNRKHSVKHRAIR